jgi:Icc-related predicted phosphoesterase
VTTNKFKCYWDQNLNCGIKMRIFFACDLHGSTAAWNKAMTACIYYKPDIIMLCGDLTGKALVPIVKYNEGEWYCSLMNRKEILHSNKEVEKLMNELSFKGIYAFETTREELEDLKESNKKVEELFLKLEKERLERWLEIARERLPRGIKLIVSPGNDDDFRLDSVIKNDDFAIYPLNNVIQLDDEYQLISCEWVNPTPWNTPRECNEKELRKRLENEFSKVDECNTLICNIHVPPYNTHLDVAPKLDNEQKVVIKAGRVLMDHVGSISVREILEERQPLLSLHGHIHESCGFSKIKRTLCLNPGSEYTQGILRGYLIQLSGEKIDFWRTEL